MHILIQVLQASGRNQAEGIYSILIFEDLIKNAKFSTPPLISKKLQSQLLIEFLF